MVTVGEYLEPARLFRMAVVLLIGILAIYIEAAPLGLGTEAPPSPDLLFCVVACWCVRQPQSIPLPLIFLLGTFRDLLTDVPVGAGALSLVLISEVLKVWRSRLSRSMFPAEWIAVAICCLVGTAVIWLLVNMTFAPAPAPGALLLQCLYTIMAYPLLVIVLRWGLRITWAPGKASR